MVGIAPESKWIACRAFLRGSVQFGLIEKCKINSQKYLLFFKGLEFMIAPTKIGNLYCFRLM